MSFEKNATMLEYRVSKYDPAIRSDGGRYTEWTSVSDVGAAFDGTVLTQTAYEEVEGLTTKPWVQEAGVDVLNQPFFARDNVATAGGCLASPYLAAWIIARLEGVEAAESALHYVAPVGEKEQFVSRAMSNFLPFLPTTVLKAA